MQENDAAAAAAFVEAEAAAKAAKIASKKGKSKGERLACVCLLRVLSHGFAGTKRKQSRCGLVGSFCCTVFVSVFAALKLLA